MVILETDRLLLRRLVPSDLDDLYALYSDPEVRRYFPEGTLTLEQTKEELEWFENGHPENPSIGLWATIYKESGEFAGRCGLLSWTIDGKQEIEIAYMLGKRFWRRGLGSEVAKALVDYGFNHLGLSRLIALVDSENVASIKTAQSAGLAFERDAMMHDGPASIYAINKG